MTVQCISCTKKKFLQSWILNQSSSLDQIIGYLLFSYSALTIRIVRIVFGTQKMNEYEYRIPLFGPNYSNSRIVRIIRPNTDAECSRLHAECSRIFWMPAESSRMLQNTCRMFQNVTECMQNVQECSRMFWMLAESSRMFQNVTECMQNVQECSRMHADPWACNYISLHAIT